MREIRVAIDCAERYCKCCVFLRYSAKGNRKQGAGLQMRCLMFGDELMTMGVDVVRGAKCIDADVTQDGGYALRRDSDCGWET